MNEFTIKTGDTRPALEARLLDEDNDPRSLQYVSGVTFHMRDRNTKETVVDDTAVVLNEPEGRVAYEWSDGDTDAEGIYEAEFELTYSDQNSGIETVPNNGYITVRIREDIA